VNSTLFSEKPAILAFGIAFDITISIPVLYLLFARIRNLPKIYIIPITILTLIIAHFILPRNYHQYLNIVKKGIILIEPFIGIFIILKIRKIIREYKSIKKENLDNFSSALKKSLIKVIKHEGISNILTTEISLIYFGLFAWRKTKTRTGAVFYSHKKCWYGSVIGVLSFLSFMETVVLHVLLVHLNSLLAWIIFAMNLYAILFLLADFNATKRQPHCISDKKLFINVGVRWRSVISLKDIHSVKLTRKDYRGEKSVLRALTLMGHPNVVIVLKKKQMAVGVYGVKKCFDKVAINLDDPRILKKHFRKKTATEDVRDQSCIF
jgi:hypothetical protein